MQSKNFQQEESQFNAGDKTRDETTENINSDITFEKNSSHLLHE